MTNRFNFQKLCDPSKQKFLAIKIAFEQPEQRNFWQNFQFSVNTPSDSKTCSEVGIWSWALTRLDNKSDCFMTDIRKTISRWTVTRQILVSTFKIGKTSQISRNVCFSRQMWPVNITVQRNLWALHGPLYSKQLHCL